MNAFLDWLAACLINLLVRLFGWYAQVRGDGGR